ELPSPYPDVHFRSTLFQLCTSEFIQIARTDNFRFRKSGFIKHSPRFNAQSNAVAEVEAHPDDFVSVLAQLPRHVDRVAHAIERIISVNQKHAVVRHGFGVSLKRLILSLEKHDPTVRLRAAHRNSEPLARLQVRRPRTTA